MRNFLTRLVFPRDTGVSVLLLVMVFVAACNAYGPKPTPAQSPTPKPTIVPPTPVGSLSTITIEPLGLTLLAPSNWKPPALLDANRAVVSQDGTADTSPNAGPFLLVVMGDVRYFRDRGFRDDVTDPVQQLNVLLKAINRDAPTYGKVGVYSTARYPAATVRSFERSNEMTITLLNAGDDRWIYVGTQAPEKYYRYYEDMFFKPAIDSMMLKSP